MIVKNTVLTWTTNDGRQRIERILWVNSFATHVLSIHIRDSGDLYDNRAARCEMRSYEELSRALANGEAKILDADPYTTPLLFDLTEKQRQRRDLLWDAIGPIVQADDVLVNAKTRATLVAIAMGRTRLSRPTLYAALRRYWQRGMTANALVPDFDKCGGLGQIKKAMEKKRGRPKKARSGLPLIIGINIDSHLQQVFRNAFDKFILEEKRTICAAFDRMLRIMLHRGYLRHQKIFVPIIPPENERPTLEQFRYWVTKFESEDYLAAAMKRKGRRRVMLEDRAVLGRSTTSLSGPGQLYQVDATLADVHLVDESRQHNIGRPIFYVVIDAFSRLIVGFHLGLENASWDTASFALINMVTKKSEYCRAWGIEIPESEWPSHHLPQAILADGGEFAGKQAENLSRYLSIELKIAAPFRADWKGIVERNFGLMNREIHWLPGAVRGPYKRCERDPRHDAALTFCELRQIMIWSIWEHNNYYRMAWYPLDEEMIRDRVFPFPASIWNWAVTRRAGYLREQHPDLVRMALLPEEEAAVTREGILFRKLYYTCPKAEAEQWFVQAGMKGRWKVLVAYDRHAVVDSILLRLQHGRELVNCHLLPKDEANRGKTWAEVEERFSARAELAIAAGPSALQGHAVAKTAIEHIASRARHATTLARQGSSKAACLSDQEKYRALTRVSDEKGTSIQKAISGEASLGDMVSPVQTEAGCIESYVAPISARAALRKQREEVWQHE